MSTVEKASAAPPSGLALGTLQVLLAEGLALPAGLVTAAYLGRTIGPSEYGLFMVAVSVTTTIQWTIASIFARATIQLVGETDAWQPAAAAALRLQAGFGLMAGVGLWVFAPVLADVFAEDRLTALFRWFALEMPIATASLACRNVLTGRRRYAARAISGAARSVSRPLFIIVLVAAGWSITGAVIGSVLAALVAYLTAQSLTGVPLRGAGPFAMRRFWYVGMPMFVLALSLRLIDRLGLLATRMLSTVGEEAGWYAAAQNFAVAPALFALSFSPLLLAVVTAARAREDTAEAARVARNALRLVFGLWPLAALAAGAAPEIVTLIFGPGFEPSARLAPALLLAAASVTTISVTSAVLMAIDRARLASACLWPVLPGTIVAHWLVVPGYGAMGAALVTAGAATVGAAASLVVVRAVLPIRLPVSTVLRSLTICLGAFALASAWSTPGLWLLAKAVVGTAAVGGAFAVLGELDAGDLRLIRRVAGGRAGT